MICEKVGIRVDIQLLRDHLTKKVLLLEPVMQGKWFGGWSVLSSDGTFRDGWSLGHTCYAVVNGREVFDEEKAKRIGLKPRDYYAKPTEICTGYLAGFMQRLELLQLRPRRARISLLKAGGQSALHRDAKDGEYAVRLHVPIITNPGCSFECDEGAVHMPADGSVYMLRVNRMHQIFNRGREDRFHLIMDVQDTAGISRHHRFKEAIEITEIADARI